MIERLTALILLSTLSLIQTAEFAQRISLTVHESGDNLTLTCSFLKNEAGLFFWYKLKFGYMIQTVAEGTVKAITLKGQFNNSRFAVDKVDTQYYLNIRNVSKEDQATYFCQVGSAYIMTVIGGTLLIVNDRKNLQKSVYVKQSPETESVHLGNSVTFQCSLNSKNKENEVQCPGEHSVYWFRSGSGEYPGILYTHSDKKDGRNCVYSWSKTIQNSSDTGTYYCAVVTCGEILFGEGTKVETRQEQCTSLNVLVVLLACCVIVIAALVFSRIQKTVCEHCKGEASNHSEHDRSAEEQPSNVDGEAAALNYVALDFSSRNAKRWKNNRELQQTCLYSGMRDPQ